jgi:mono/diheme cytochrome c family protein
MTSRALFTLPLLSVLWHHAAAADAASAAEAGHALAKERCGSCHAVEKDDISALQSAPPFRTLGKRYTLESLEEALAEGIFAGHPAMPDVPWDPADIRQLIAYLKTIQAK